MAYMNQETKKILAPAIKAVLAKYGLKGTISVHNHSTIAVNIKEGAIDFIGIADRKKKKKAEWTGRQYYPVQGYYQENPYRRYEPYDRPVDIAEQCINELQDAMRGDIYYNNNDIQVDYFDSAYYMDINIGKWDKHYVYTGAAA